MLVCSDSRELYELPGSLLTMMHCSSFYLLWPVCLHTPVEFVKTTLHTPTEFVETAKNARCDLPNAARTTQQTHISRPALFSALSKLNWAQRSDNAAAPTPDYQRRHGLTPEAPGPAASPLVIVKLPTSQLTACVPHADGMQNGYCIVEFIVREFLPQKPCIVRLNMNKSRGSPGAVGRARAHGAGPLSRARDRLSPSLRCPRPRAPCQWRARGRARPSGRWGPSRRRPSA
jgi:hypothetical protein